MSPSLSLKVVVTFLGISVLAACGGDDAPAVPPTPPMVSGTVATPTPPPGPRSVAKANPANATVQLKDALGQVVTTTTDANGAFSINVSGLTPPFRLAFGPVAAPTQFSMGNGPGTTNITPLTNAAFNAACIARGTTASATFAQTAFGSAATPPELNQYVAAINAILAPALKENGFANPSTFNPFSTAFVPNDSVSKALDNATISSNGNGFTVSVSTPDPANPSGPPAYSASSTVSVSCTGACAADGSNSTTTVTSTTTANTTGQPSPPPSQTFTPPPGTLQFSAATYTVAENVASHIATITVTRTGGDAGQVTAHYAASDGTANSTKYQLTPGDLTWLAGDVASKSFDVTIIDESAVEGSKTVNLTLTSATLGTPNTAVLTITDDDVPPAGNLVFSATNYPVAENVAGGTVTITVNRVGGSAGAIGVSFNSTPGTAVVPGDYGAAGGSLAWPDGDMTSRSFTVSIANDTAPESTENFGVHLTNPTGGAGLGTPHDAIVTITDDDGPPAFARDFFLPYGTLNGPKPQNGGCCNNLPYSRVDAVSSSNFATKLTDITGGAPTDASFTLETIDISGNTATNQRPVAFLFHASNSGNQGSGVLAGRWYRVDLRTSASSHAPVQVSSEVVPTVCKAEDFEPETTGGTFTLNPIVVYRVPGASSNNTCNNATDEYRVIHANNGPGVAPIVLTGVTNVLNDFLDKTTGQLKAVTVVQGGNLVYLDGNFANPVTLHAAPNGVRSVSDNGLNAFFYGIGADLFRVALQPDGTTVAIGNSLLTLSGETFDDNGNSKDDDTNNYFIAETLDQQSNPTQSRLYRVKRDGTQNAVMMFSCPGRVNLGHATTNKVILVCNAATSGDTSLVSVDKTADNNVPAALFLEVASNICIDQPDTAGANVYYTVKGGSCNSSPTSITAKIKTENNTAPGFTNVFNNAAWVGQTRQETFNLTTEHGDQNVAYFLRADNPTSLSTTDLFGATLINYKVSDNSEIAWPATVGSDNSPPGSVRMSVEGFGSGPVGMGVFNIGSQTTQDDVFVFDTELNLYARMTNMSPANEQPAGQR